MNDFITNFADIFDETPLNLFNTNTNFKDLGEWSSLHGLATINMVELKYNVQLKASDIVQANTIQDLIDLICSKK
jgi:acyl carrier protein